MTLQQMGGNRKELVNGLQKKGVPLLPVAIDDLTKINPLYQQGTVVQLDAPGLPEGFANFYRSDDVSSTAYFYLDKPVSALPELQPLNIRVYQLRRKR